MHERQTMGSNAETMPGDRSASHHSGSTEDVNGAEHLTETLGPAAAPAFNRLLDRAPWLARFWPESPTAGFALRVLAVLVTFVALDALLSRAASLTNDAYENSALFVEVARRFGWGVSGTLILGLVFLLRWGAGMSHWRELQYGPALRIFVVSLSIIAAWPFVTQGYNYYFDQGHFLDRALIIALLPLIWWRPVFVLPFLFLIYAMMGQLVEPPLGGTILAHKLQLTRAIGLFGATFVIHAFSGQRRTDHYIFLTCCFVAAAYWLPALAKLRLDWVTSDHLYTVPLAAYAHGWLGNLSPAEIVAFARSLIWLDPVMRVAVIIVEVACLIFLVHRRVTLWLLVAVIVFHLGVFALFGFFFWTWIALDAALLILLLRGIRAFEEYVHLSVRLGLSVALILGASWWAKPPSLGWYDTPLSYVYHIDAVTSDGQSHRLHPKFFAPYEDVFTMASFGYLVQQHSVIVGAYGVTHDREIHEALDAARSAEDVYEIERAIAPQYDEERAAAFYRFLERFVSTRNTRGDIGSVLYALHSPPQFWSQIDGLREIGDRHLRQLIVRELTTFYNGKTLEVIRTVEIARLNVPEGPASR